MQGNHMEKIIGGKLLAVSVEYEDKVKKIVITGDFFIHPEDALADIEKAFIGADLSLGSIKEKLERLIEDEGIMLIGFAVDDLIRVARGALR